MIILSSVNDKVKEKLVRVKGSKIVLKYMDLLSPIAPKRYSYGLTLMGYKYNSK